jgi:hypothetical protein
MALANITKPTGTKTATFGSKIFGSPSTAATTAAPATTPAANPNTLSIGGNSNFVTTNTSSKDPGAAMGPYQDPAKNIVTTVPGGAAALKMDTTQDPGAEMGPFQDSAKNVVATAAPVSTYTPIADQYAGKTPAELSTLASAGIKQATTTGYTPTAQKTSSYTPTNWAIDPEATKESQTVQGQLQGIIAANSPLLQQAEAQARQQMNQRGLLNTSMAVGAGQEAVIKQALPIATQDATLFANQAKYNADIATSAAQFEAAAKNTAFGADKAAQDAAAQFKAAAENASSANYTKDVNTTMSQMMDQSLKIGLANADNATRLQIQQIDADTRKYLMDTEAIYKNKMQASASATDLYVNITKSIATIMADPNLDVDAKQAAVNLQKGYLSSGLDILGQTSGVEGIDALLDFSSDTTTTTKPEVLTSDADFQAISKQYGNILDTSGGATVDKTGATTLKFKDPNTNKTLNFKLPPGSYFNEVKGQVVDAAGAVIPIPSGLIAGAVDADQRPAISEGVQEGDYVTDLADIFAETNVNFTGAKIDSKGNVSLKYGTLIPAGARADKGVIFKRDGSRVDVKPKDKI